MMDTDNLRALCVACHNKKHFGTGGGLKT
jgi:5-methylcytosine-specific restriction endonuclease McrA